MSEQSRRVLENMKQRAAETGEPCHDTVVEFQAAVMSEQTYKYLMLYRPLSIGTQPSGFVAYTELLTGSRGYGILEYQEPLTLDQLRDYELEEIK